MTDEERARFDEASQESIRNGGLPLNAIARLQEQEKRHGTPEQFFSSDLSVNELLLTRQCGYEPLGQVMGSCVYNVGWQYIPQGVWVYSSQEFSVLSGAHMEARKLAFNRLQQEAALLKADGVVGVRFIRKGEGLFQNGLEYIALGTAVRAINEKDRYPGPPFVSNLTGQQHYALRQEGFRPVGFVFGNCTWLQYPDWRSQNALLSFRNAELTSLTQGMYTARSLAVGRMEAEAISLSAKGVVQAVIEHSIEEIEANNSRYFLMTFLSFGTAIASDYRSSEVGEVKPIVSLSSN
ncbi:MAG: heavy metal-binding domain-containing protein [Armatimonadetes bacterium]|nr:heavy metal-binding domain-containing protein [Armatimonadota bacterium]